MTHFSPGHDGLGRDISVRMAERARRRRAPTSWVGFATSFLQHEGVCTTCPPVDGQLRWLFRNQVLLRILNMPEGQVVCHSRPRLRWGKLRRESSSWNKCGYVSSMRE